MKTVKLFMATLVAAAMFTSCGKDGAPGTNGTNGVANISTSVGTAQFSDWTQSGVSSQVYYVQFSVPQISNYSTDAVMAYIQGTTTPYDYYALPLSDFFGSDEFSFSYNNGKVTIYYQYTNGNPTQAPSQTLTFKVVVIPPAVIKQHPGLNLNDYKAVMAIYNAQQHNLGSK